MILCSYNVMGFILGLKKIDYVFENDFRKKSLKVGVLRVIFKASVVRMAPRRPAG